MAAVSRRISHNKEPFMVRFLGPLINLEIEEQKTLYFTMRSSESWE